jgi:hypothetical protein
MKHRSIITAIVYLIMTGGSLHAQTREEPVSKNDPELKLKEIMSRITRNLRLVEDRLAQADAGVSTQQVQRDIARDMSDLVEQAKRDSQQSPPNRNNSASRASAKQQASRPSSDTKARSAGSRLGSETLRPASSRTSAVMLPNDPSRRQGEISKIADLYKDIWGHLPETIRQEMDQYSRERFMPKYEELLKQYYATIAEKGKRKE